MPALCGESHWPNNRGRSRAVAQHLPEEAPVSVSISLNVNGKAVSASVDPRTLLVQLLREHLRLTGTHVGRRKARA